MKLRRKNEKRGVAAVEAAICLPIIVLIWLGSFEVTQLLSLKQQGQLLCATAAHRIIEGSAPFATIEADIVTLSEGIGIEDAIIEIRRLDSEVVESVVTIDVTKNSMLGSIFENPSVSTAYYSYREE